MAALKVLRIAGRILLVVVGAFIVVTGLSSIPGMLAGIGELMLGVIPVLALCWTPTIVLGHPLQEVRG